MMNWKEKFKHYYSIVVNSKYYKWFIAILNLLLFAFILELITGNSSFGNITGWSLLIIILVVNLWGIWASRKFIKGFKDYVFFVAEEKALKHKEKKKDES